MAGSVKTEIRVMRIADYILHTVGPRYSTVQYSTVQYSTADYILHTVGPRLVPGSSGGAVVMKLDVEGREMSIICHRKHLVLSFYMIKS